MKLNINGREIEVADEELSKAIEEKKESLEIKSDLSIRTAEEETTFVENLKTGSNTAAYEIGRKNVLKGLGIEVEGQHKSDEAAINAVNVYDIWCRDGDARSQSYKLEHHIIRNFEPYCG